MDRRKSGNKPPLVPIRQGFVRAINRIRDSITPIDFTSKFQYDREIASEEYKEARREARRILSQRKPE